MFSELNRPSISRTLQPTGRIRSWVFIHSFVHSVFTESFTLTLELGMERGVNETCVLKTNVTAQETGPRGFTATQ